MPEWFRTVMYVLLATVTAVSCMSENTDTRFVFANMGIMILAAIVLLC